MKRTILLLAGCLLSLACCGCSSGSSAEGSAECSTEKTNTDSSSAASDISNTTAHSDTDTASVSDTATKTQTSVPDDTSDANSAESELFQGGIGEEKDASTPKPEFFNYIFQPDAFTARLAGGTYQTVPCDLSEGFRHNIDAEFCLKDYDADGDYDLWLPAVYDQSRVTEYMIFLWDAEAEKFRTESVTAAAAN